MTKYRIIVPKKHIEITRSTLPQYIDYFVVKTKNPGRKTPDLRKAM